MLMSGPKGDEGRQQVLVVDDEPPMRTALTRALELGGFEVALAADGEHGLSQISELEPDLVVLDVMMPRLDGLGVCRLLRARGDRTPVLMLTARDAVADRVEGLEAGADDYLVKPFALEELLARIRALLRRTARRRGRGTARASPTWSWTAVACRVTPRGARAAADPHRVPAARAAAREPAPGADPGGDLRPGLGL